MSNRNRKNLFGWLDFGSSVFGNVANVIGTILNNKSNERIAAAQNAAQMLESEKAYQRSKPINQVNQLQAAGMSKAGALATLNGGASYTPAPMTSHAAQAPQVDLTSAFDGLLQVGENAKQRKMQEEMLDKQLKYQAEQAQKQRDHELLLKDIDTANQTQHDYLEYEKHKETLGFSKYQFDSLKPYQIRQIVANISKVEADTKVSEQNLMDLQYKYAEYVSTQDVRDAEALVRKLESIYNYAVTEKDFNYFKRRFMYYDEKDNTWRYVGVSRGTEMTEKYAQQFWDFIAQVIPANKVAEIFRFILK